MYPILLKSRINRGNLNSKFNMCIKWCVGGQKSISYEIPRGIILLKIKPVSAIWSYLSRDPFSQTTHYKSLYFVDNYNNFDNINLC